MRATVRDSDERDMYDRHDVAQPARRSRNPEPTMSTSEDAAPVRRAICLACRTLLREGAHCAHSRHHTVVSLQTDQGRDAFHREVWETPYVRLGLLPGDGWLVGATALSPVIVGLVWLSIPAAVTMAVAAWSALAGGALWRFRQRRLAPPSPPRGRPGYLRPPRRGPRWHGTIEATDSITAPLTKRPCLGYSVVLRANEFFGGDVMSIDAWIRGGNVVLDDGRTLHLPEGPIEIDDSAAVEITDRTAVARYLDAIAPALSSDARQPLVYDTVTESIVPIGARLEVLGKVVEVPGLYRDAGRHWRVRDVPRVRVLAPAHRDGEP